MCDKREKAAVLRGFDMSVADVGDQLHLRHPLLSFKGEPDTLYVARRFNWRNSPEALAVADPSEASELATLLPDGHGRPMASGEGAVVAGAGFVQAAADAGVQLDGPEISFAKAHESGCWMGAAAQSVFAALESGLVDEAQAAFDGALGDAARRSQRLPERGNAALPILRGCGPRRREGLAVRQLAGARQNRDSGLHQRLLIRFELELGARRADLHGKVERRIELAASPLQGEAAKRAT